MSETKYTTITLCGGCGHAVHTSACDALRNVASGPCSCQHHNIVWNGSEKPVYCEECEEIRFVGEDRSSVAVRLCPPHARLDDAVEKIRAERSRLVAMESEILDPASAISGLDFCLAALGVAP